MTTASKRRLVGFFLAAAALWPLVHLGLVARYDLSRWKLAGWGMYTEPGMKDAGMEVFGRQAAGAAAEQLRAADAGMQAAAEEFLYDYRWLRRLSRPDAFAAAVLAAQPTWRELDIDVFRPYVEPYSGRVEQDHVRFRYVVGPDGPRLVGIDHDL